MIRVLALTTVLAGAVALPSLAQTTPSPAPTAPAITAPSANSVMLTADEAKNWVGKPVYSSDDKKIGEVVAFARSTDNSVTEMHAGIGGFLGLGETNVRVMPAQFKLAGDRVMLNMTSEQSRPLPKVTK